MDVNDKNLNVVETKSNAFLPWVEKYRPNYLHDIISQGHVIDTISRYIGIGQLPHLLFHGPPGTGKTSAILALASHIYGPLRNAFVLELNASDDRGINTVREQIKSFAETRMCIGQIDENGIDQLHKESNDSMQENPIYNIGLPKSVHYSEHINKLSNIKLIILDEADQMTQAAQNALRRIMEKYARNVRFCFLCNYVNKINPAIQSRCSRFRFAPLDIISLQKRTMEIAKLENLNLVESGLSALLKIAKGDMRRILNTLQSISMISDNGVVDDKLVYMSLAMPTNEVIIDVFKGLMQLSFFDAHKRLMSYHHEAGYSCQDFVNGLYEYILKIDWPNTAIIQLIIRLADIEERLAEGSNEKIQLYALVGAFFEARFELERLKFCCKI